MNHIIYSLLSQYELDRGNTVSALRSLKKEDFNNFLDKLDEWYISQRETITTKFKDSDMFSVWLPRTKVENITELTSRFLIFDKVIADDSLYNTLISLESGESNESKLQSDMFLKQFLKKTLQTDLDFDVIESIGDECGLNDVADEIWNEISYQKAANLIEFYLAAKDLVIEDLFVPYVDLDIKIPADYSNIFIENILKMPEFMESIQKIVNNVSPPEKAISSVNDLIIFIKSIIGQFRPAILNFFNQTIDDYNLAVAIAFATLLSKPPTPSLDFLDQNSHSILNTLIRAHHSSYSLKTSNEMLLYPFSRNTLEIPTLGNLPIQEILEVKYKNKDSFENFKNSILTKAAKICSSPGSDDWEKEILATKLNLKKEINEINKAFEDLKRNHVRRFSVELVSVSLSIAIAAFGVIGQGLPDLKLFQTVIGGAGFAASLKAIASNWILFKKEKASIEAKDNYFLWRLSGNKSEE